METVVTAGLYAEVMRGEGTPDGSHDLPLVSVSWLDAVRFCNALSSTLGLSPAYQGAGEEWGLIEGATGYRLPLESEWEWAAKGGAFHPYSGSYTLDDVAWHERNSGGGLQAVGQKQPNGYALFDMSGNVWEWCADDFDRPGSHQPHARARARRGGSWRELGSVYCTLSARASSSPDTREDHIGIRLCRALSSRSPATPT